MATGLGLTTALWNRGNRGPDVAAPIQGHTLKYTLEAQRALRGVPQGEPYEASVDDTFQSGQRFRLRLAPAQPGFVYVINEGAGRNQAVWLLHPRHGQSAFVPPESKYTEWYVFDEHPGTERLWLVWAERPLDEMERALRATRDGELKDAGVARSIRTWIHNLPKASPQRQRNGNYTIQLHGAGGVLADLLELRHE